MSRVKENKKTIDSLSKKAQKAPSGTVEQMTNWYLGTIGTILADISKSLAIIADGMSGIEGKHDSGRK